MIVNLAQKSLRQAAVKLIKHTCTAPAMSLCTLSGVAHSFHACEMTNPNCHQWQLCVALYTLHAYKITNERQWTTVLSTSGWSASTQLCVVQLSGTVNSHEVCFAIHSIVPVKAGGVVWKWMTSPLIILANGQLRIHCGAAVTISYNYIATFGCSWVSFGAG